MTRYLIGSKLLKIDTESSDCDYFDYLGNDTEEPTNRFVCKDGCDIWECNEAFLDRRLHLLTLTGDALIDCDKFKCNYQYDADIIGQDFPYEFHILDYKKEYISLLKFMVRYGACGLNEDIASEYCQKELYHIAYMIFILKNDSTKLTSAQRKIVKDIHDGVKPISYIKTLKNYIAKLN